MMKKYVNIASDSVSTVDEKESDMFSSSTRYQATFASPMINFNN